MKLIKEVFEQNRVIVEDKDGKKNLYLEGVFLQAEVKS